MSKSLNHCHTELFTIYQNKHWTIRWWGDHSFDPSSHCIILKIVVFLVTCLVMSKGDFIFTNKIVLLNDFIFKDYSALLLH